MDNQNISPIPSQTPNTPDPQINLPSNKSSISKWIIILILIAILLSGGIYLGLKSQFKTISFSQFTPLPSITVPVVTILSSNPTLTPQIKTQCPRPCPAGPIKMPCQGPVDSIDADVDILSVDKLKHPEMVSGSDTNIQIKKITEYHRDECATYREIKQNDNVKVTVTSLRGRVAYDYNQDNSTKIYESLNTLIGKTVNISMTCTENCIGGIIRKIY